MRFSRLLLSLLFQLRRLHDPQVQVWVMAGLSVLLLLMGHLRAWSGSGEGKNDATASASRLLLAGARVTWTEEFGPAQQGSRRPVLCLQAPAAGGARPLPGPPAVRLDLRSPMEEAAARPWQFLDRSLRQQLAAAPRASLPLQIRLVWSGDTRGNAALVSRQQAAPQAPAGFVIGNGSRSGDGQIEALRPSLSMAEGLVEITLIGTGSALTPRQSAALGELLHQLEAISGHLLLPDSAAI